MLQCKLATAVSFGLSAQVWKRGGGVGRKMLAVHKCAFGGALSQLIFSLKHSGCPRPPNTPSNSVIFSLSLPFPPVSRFLYSDEVQIGPETVMTTLYTAKKYAVPALEAHCVEFLKKNLRADNAFMLLTQVCWAATRLRCRRSSVFLEPFMPFVPETFRALPLLQPSSMGCHLFVAAHAFSLGVL